jgi:hypothetical protein
LEIISDDYDKVPIQILKFIDKKQKIRFFDAAARVQKTCSGIAYFIDFFKKINFFEI